ncbi:MAG: hypothetical protein AAGH92_01015 [Planctomycetota bacterium]
MSRQSFIPASDSELNVFGLNFTSYLEAAPTPGTYGLSDADASAFADAQAAYTAALAKANAEATRGPLSIAQKDNAKKTFKDVIRKTAAIVQAFPGTTDDMRAELRLPVRDTVPTPIPAPAAELKISVEAVSGTQFHVRLSDPEHPPRRRKPDHATTATLLYHVGETAPTTIEGWTLSGTVSKTRTIVQVNPQTTPGSKVWFIGYWSNGKGESGNPGQPVAAFTQFTEGGLTELRIAA